MSNSLQPHGLQHARLPLFFTISRSLLTLLSIESVMPSNCLILYHPLPLLPSVFPSTTKETLPRWYSDKESVHQCRRHKRHGFYHCVGKIPWSRKWQLTPVFLLGDPMDRGAWQAIVLGVAKSWHNWTHTQGAWSWFSSKGHNKIKGDIKAERWRAINCLWASWHAIS